MLDLTRIIIFHQAFGTCADRLGETDQSDGWFHLLEEIVDKNQPSSDTRIYVSGFSEPPLLANRLAANSLMHLSQFSEYLSIQSTENRNTWSCSVLIFSISIHWSCSA